MHAQARNGRVRCSRCDSSLPETTRFCSACGHRLSFVEPTALPDAATDPITRDGVVSAGGGVRFTASLLDIAAMMSPTLPLSIAAAVLAVAEIVYVVMPVAFLAVWLWMQIWQGLTGFSFGKSMMGLRLVRAVDDRPPGFAAVLLRSGVFVGTLGLAAIPVLRRSGACSGLHDRVSGLKVIDVVLGDDPVGPSPHARLRRISPPRVGTRRPASCAGRP